MRGAMLLVVALIAVLALGQRSPKGEPDQIVTLSRAKQLVIACLIYASDYDEALPLAKTASEFQKATFPYVKSRDVYKTLNPAGGDLAFNGALSGALLTAVKVPTETVIVHDSKPWPDGTRVVAFADGHAKVLGKTEWTKVEPSLRAKYAKPKRRGGQ